MYLYILKVERSFVSVWILTDHIETINRFFFQIHAIFYKGPIILKRRKKQQLSNNNVLLYSDQLSHLGKATFNR